MGKRILYVTGFGHNTRARDLAHAFERYGRLVRCDIPAGRRDAKAFAFVEYEDSNDAADAFDRMHDQYVDDSRIAVQWAKRPPARSWRFENGDERRGGGGGGSRSRSRSPQGSGRRSRYRSRSRSRSRGRDSGRSNRDGDRRDEFRRDVDRRDDSRRGDNRHDDRRRGGRDGSPARGSRNRAGSRSRSRSRGRRGESPGRGNGDKPRSRTPPSRSPRSGSPRDYSRSRSRSRSRSHSRSPARNNGDGANDAVMDETPADHDDADAHRGGSGSPELDNHGDDAHHPDEADYDE
ncbi:hypothetical protein IWQ57_001288 [Coemansia nantahalensis]|uniref:Uncharacterized protein n=1 Tax=Coemansia nantahalensis TaxID=2789366 RepID=A0ACC1K4J8_9FUNG|nr:hypothetical protein IWQ57_001288 [Coemansia nantahalensis]